MMTQAPERIWATGQNAQPSGRWWHETELKSGIEYIRADLVPQWQPIETAPKDGTSVLIMVDDVVIEGRWVDNRSGTSGEWHYVTLNSHGCGCCGSDDPSPTHWMPLPAPPS